MTEKEKLDLHMKMLSKSFHRESDNMTSILLGDAVSIAVDYFSKLQDTIKSCEGCKHIEYKNECLKFSVMPDTCRTCSRQSTDRYEVEEK